MPGRQARLLFDIIIGLPHVWYDVDTHDFMAEAQTSLELAFEIVRRDLAERSDKQRRVNQTFGGSYAVFKPGQQFLLYKLHRSTDGPYLELLFPRRGPYTIQA